MKSLRVALGGLMIVAACSGCAAMLEGSLDRLERRLTFFPRKLSKEKPVPQGVKSVWFDVTDVAAAGQSASEPGSVTPSAAPAETRVWRLHGVIAEAPDPTRRRAVLMYCHGNRGCVDDCVGRMRDTANRFNVTAFTFDYRGFGRSEGIPNEAGILQDARAARAWLARHTGVAERSIVVQGMSLGGGVAVDLAGRDGCRGLILENTFTSMSDAVDGFAGPLMKPSTWMKAKLNSIETIKNYHGPLLQRHGDADPLIPYSQGRELFAAAPGPKKFITMQGGMHRTLPNEEFLTAMDEFLNFLPPEEGYGQSANIPEFDFTLYEPIKF